MFICIPCFNIAHIGYIPCPIVAYSKRNEKLDSYIERKRTFNWTYSNTRKYAHITPVLKSLHWLPVEQRLMYKILLITFRALKFSSPQYINSLIEIYKPSRSGLRSSAEFSLAIPKSKRTWGDRAFASAAPHLWNSLPKSIHLSESVDIFKSKLKTHLMEGIFLEWRNIYFERSTLWAPWASFGWKCLRVTNICIIIIIIINTNSINMIFI